MTTEQYDNALQLLTRFDGEFFALLDRCSGITQQAYDLLASIHCGKECLSFLEPLYQDMRKLDDARGLLHKWIRICDEERWNHIPLAGPIPPSKITLP